MSSFFTPALLLVPGTKTNPNVKPPASISAVLRTITHIHVYVYATAHTYTHQGDVLKYHLATLWIAGYKGYYFCGLTTHPFLQVPDLRAPKFIKACVVSCVSRMRNKERRGCQQVRGPNPTQVECPSVFPKQHDMITLRMFLKTSLKRCFFRKLISESQFCDTMSGSSVKLI